MENNSTGQCKDDEGYSFSSEGYNSILQGLGEMQRYPQLVFAK